LKEPAPSGTVRLLTGRSVSRVDPALREQERDRVADILDAACSVIARDGWHGLRVGAVAREAGVSKALVHYYFATRAVLLRAAFGHSERRANELLERELTAIEDAGERLERFLVAYLDDDPAYRENRAAWTEIWAAMRIDPELRSEVDPAYRTWLEQLVEHVRDARAPQDGAGEEDEDVALRLAALLDGIESLLLLELVSAEDARAIIRRALERDVGAAATAKAAAQSHEHEEAT
jgi:AcrR family transcriptional regulator